MKTDIDFQLESMAWLRSTRGDDWIDRLADSIRQCGTETALSRVVHPAMSSDEREAYAAAIKFIEWSSLAAA